MSTKTAAAVAAPGPSAGLSTDLPSRSPVPYRGDALLHTISATCRALHAVYFDRRPGLVASPIQAYLELATGDNSVN